MRKLLLTALLAVPAFPAFACDEARELRLALEQARSAARDGRREAARSAIAEAVLLKDVMERYLTPVYFPGIYDMSSEPAVIEVGDGAAYRAVSGRLVFLRGAPGSKITLAPGKDRAAQFAALAADYASALEKAAGHLKAAGEDPSETGWLWGLAEWGRQTRVQDGAAERSVLTPAQRDAIMAPAAASPEPAPRDPRE